MKRYYYLFLFVICLSVVSCASMFYSSTEGIKRLSPGMDMKEVLRIMPADDYLIVHASGNEKTLRYSRTSDDYYDLYFLNDILTGWKLEFYPKYHHRVYDGKQETVRNDKE